MPLINLPPFGSISGAPSWDSGMWVFGSAVQDLQSAKTATGSVAVVGLKKDRVLQVADRGATNNQMNATSMSAAGTVLTENAVLTSIASDGQNNNNWLNAERVSDSRGILTYRANGGGGRAAVLDVDGSENVTAGSVLSISDANNGIDCTMLDATTPIFFTYTFSGVFISYLKKGSISGTTISISNTTQIGNSSGGSPTAIISAGVFTIDSTHVGVIGRGFDGSADTLDVRIYTVAAGFTEIHSTSLENPVSPDPDQQIQVVKLRTSGNTQTWLALIDTTGAGDFRLQAFDINTSSYTVTNSSSYDMITGSNSNGSEIVRLNDDRAAFMTNSAEFHVVDVDGSLNIVEDSITDVSTEITVSSSTGQRCATFDGDGADPARLYIGSGTHAVIIKGT